MASSLNVLFQPIVFQSIVDTAAHRILGHHCEFGEMPFELVPGAIRSAAGKWGSGRYFIGSDIFNPSFRSILDAVTESNLDPANFVLEVAECGRDQDLRENWEWYRSNGFGLAFTYAGTGTDSLQTIQDFQPDFIKLDPVLVRDIERPKNAAIIQKLSGLAEKLGICIVANGVERHRTIENLWLLGIQIMQGHLFGPPSSSMIHSNTADLANLATALEPLVSGVMSGVAN